MVATYVAAAAFTSASASAAIAIAIATRQLRLYANAHGFRHTTFCTFRAPDPLPCGEDRAAAVAPRKTVVVSFDLVTGKGNQ